MEGPPKCSSCKRDFTPPTALSRLAGDRPAVDALLEDDIRKSMACIQKNVAMYNSGAAVGAEAHQLSKMVFREEITGPVHPTQFERICLPWPSIEEEKMKKKAKRNKKNDKTPRSPLQAKKSPARKTKALPATPTEAKSNQAPGDQVEEEEQQPPPAKMAKKSAKPALTAKAKKPAKPVIKTKKAKKSAPK